MYTEVKEAAQGAPPEPPPIPEIKPAAGSEARKPYHIPLYPLPPSPADAQPPSMPFAKIDWEHHNAFTPPKLEFKKGIAGDGEGMGAETSVQGGSEAILGKGIAYEMPPLVKEDAKAFKGGGT